MDGDGCQECSKGTYNNVQNGTTCIPCPMGSTTENNRTVNEWECGMYQRPEVEKFAHEGVPGSRNGFPCLIILRLLKNIGRSN